MPVHSSAASHPSPLRSAGRNNAAAALICCTNGELGDQSKSAAVNSSSPSRSRTSKSSGDPRKTLALMDFLPSSAVHFRQPGPIVFLLRRRLEPSFPGPSCDPLRMEVAISAASDFGSRSMSFFALASSSGEIFAGEVL